MKLSEWARKQGINYRTAWRWFKTGQLPVTAVQTATGTILVQEAETAAEKSVALYARVSSSDQKGDAQRQLGRLVKYASENGLQVSKTVTEIGSGLNGRRGKLKRLLSDASVSVIVVEHRDRLMRFGAQYVEAALVASGRELIVVDAGELKDDLVQDMRDVLRSFGARLYGRRSAKHKAKQAMAAIGVEDVV